MCLPRIVMPQALRRSVGRRLFLSRERTRAASLVRGLIPRWGAFGTPLIDDAQPGNTKGPELYVQSRFFARSCEL